MLVDNNRTVVRHFIYEFIMYSVFCQVFFFNMSEKKKSFVTKGVAHLFTSIAHSRMTPLGNNELFCWLKYMQEIYSKLLPYLPENNFFLLLFPFDMTATQENNTPRTMLRLN